MNSSTSAAPKRNNGRRPLRWLPWLGALVLAALLVAGLWPKPAPVEIARVTIGALRTSINEEGKTRIRHRYLVSAPVAGQLRRIPLKAGAAVTSNQVVAVIDPLPPALLDARTRTLAEARRDTATAQLERARAAYKFAALELRRSESLRATKTVSDHDLEQAQWRDTATARDLTAAESTLREAEAELAEFATPTLSNRPPVEIKVPTDGRVLRVFEESSRVVLSGAPLLEVGDPADLEVLIEVLSRDGAMLAPDTPVELEQWGGGEPLQAQVRFVEPAAFTKVSALGVEEQRVYVVADLLTPPAQRGNLGDNFRVEARIITWQTARTLKAPSGALFRRDDQWNAYVLVAGKVQLRPVKVGRSRPLVARVTAATLVEDTPR